MENRDPEKNISFDFELSVAKAVIGDFFLQIIKL
jgi:hypothetical protein